MTDDRNNEETAALAVRGNVAVDRIDRIDRHAFEPATWEQAFRAAEVLCKSGMVPTGVDTVQKCMAIIVQGRELGLSMMQSLRGIHVIEGRPTLAAALMVALVMDSGKAEYFELVDTNSERCTYETKRKGARNPTTLTWTIGDAETAELLNNAKKPNWRRYPADMLRARCQAALARAVYPDVIFGIYDPDEIGEVIDVTPTPAPCAPPDPEKVPLLARMREVNAALDALEKEIDPATFAKLAGKARVDLRTLEEKETALVLIRAAWSLGASEPKEAPSTNDAKQPGPASKQAPEAAQSKPADGDAKATPPPSEPASEDDEPVPTVGEIYAAARSAGLNRELVEICKKQYGRTPDKLTDAEKRALHGNFRARAVLAEARRHQGGGR